MKTAAGFLGKQYFARNRDRLGAFGYSLNSEHMRSFAVVHNAACGKRKLLAVRYDQIILFRAPLHRLSHNIRVRDRTSVVGKGNGSRVVKNIKVNKLFSCAANGYAGCRQNLAGA